MVTPHRHRGLPRPLAGMPATDRLVGIDCDPPAAGALGSAPSADREPVGDELRAAAEDLVKALADD